MPDTRCLALPKKANFARESQNGRGSMIVGMHRTRTSRRAPASSLIRWRPSHGGPLWRAQQWWQTKKHMPMLGAALPVGELVTLVIEDERFFGWVAAAAPAQSVACVAIEFKRGSQRVQERIPVENIQRLKEYLQAHPELRTPQEPGAPLRHE